MVTGETPGVFGLIWLVPALPLLGAVINGFFGRRTRDRAGWIASSAVVGSFAVAVALLVGLLAQPATSREFVQHLYSWVPVGSFEVGVNLRADPLSITMALVITGVGALIHIYSIGYMDGDPRYSRFFAQLNLFVFFMLVLVLADNFLLLFLGWEGVGLCSYLLIGHYQERPAAANAAKKAFVVTRIGDTAMLIGIALIFVRFHSLDFESTIYQRCIVHFVAPPCDLYAQFLAQMPYTAIALLLLAGAVGKSAQMPLQTWLPDAMEGPTPVSALIHAATMVTAGVYLIVRTEFFFASSGVALTVVLVIGLVTALYAATAALAQDDLKRVLAYSTMSQIGLMFFAVGMRAYTAAMFLLVAHAFYKALLFLASGNVMHALDGELDVKRMGGLRRALPATFALFTVGWLAIAGIPPLAGFFAKDQVVAVASQTGRTAAYVLALIVSFLSAMYVSRLAFLAFFGRRRGEHRPHESPAIMTLPMTLLAIGAAVGGVLGLSAASGLLARFLEPVVGEVTEGIKGPSTLALALISSAVAAAGVVVAYFVYASGRFDWLGARKRLRPVHATLASGWWFDTVYGATLVAPGRWLARFSSRAIDRGVVDRAGNSLGRLVALTAGAGRRLQTGLVRTYAVGFVLGVVALLAFLAVRF